MRLLVADSERRLSLDEIKGHAWFIHSLPSGTHEMNDYYLNVNNGVDEVAVRPLTPRTSTVYPRWHVRQESTSLMHLSRFFSSELILVNQEPDHTALSSCDGPPFRVELLISKSMCCKLGCGGSDVVGI